MMRNPTSCVAVSVLFLVFISALLPSSVHGTVYTICLPGEGGANDAMTCDEQYDWIKGTLLPRCLAAGRFFNRAFVSTIEVEGSTNRRRHLEGEAANATNLVNIKQHLISMLKEDQDYDEEEDGLLMDEHVLDAAALDLQQRLVAFYNEDIMSVDEEHEVGPAPSHGMDDEEDNMPVPSSSSAEGGSFEEDVVEPVDRRLTSTGDKCKSCMYEACNRYPIPEACCILCGQNCCYSSARRRRRLVNQEGQDEDAKEKQQTVRRNLQTFQQDIQMERRAQQTMKQYLELVNNLCTYVIRMKGIMTGCFGDSNGARCTSFMIL